MAEMSAGYGTVLNVVKDKYGTSSLGEFVHEHAPLAGQYTGAGDTQLDVAAIDFYHKNRDAILNTRPQATRQDIQHVLLDAGNTYTQLEDIVAKRYATLGFNEETSAKGAREAMNALKVGQVTGLMERVHNGEELQADDKDVSALVDEMPMMKMSPIRGRKPLEVKPNPATERSGNGVQEPAVGEAHKLAELVRENIDNLTASLNSWINDQRTIVNESTKPQVPPVSVRNEIPKGNILAV